MDFTILKCLLFSKRHPKFSVFKNHVQKRFMLFGYEFLIKIVFFTTIAPLYKYLKIINGVIKYSKYIFKI